MRRTLSALILVVMVSGCSALNGALPNRSATLDDAMGMTVEQYAIGRLPGAHRTPMCPKPGHVVATRTPKAPSPAKRCRAK
jgi:hypothetical protein